MTRRRALGIALAACALVGGAAGCLSPRSMPAMVYYTLAPPGEPSARLPGPIRVERFEVDAAYSPVRLAHRSSPYRLEYYSFHRWAGTPEDAVTGAVRGYLGGAAVAPGEADDAALTISGAVRVLEERAEPSGRSGVLAIDFDVHRGGVLVLERGYRETEPAEAATPEATVAALSRALARMLDHLVEDVRQAEAATAGGTHPSADRAGPVAVHLEGV